MANGKTTPNKWQKMRMDERLDSLRGWAMHGASDDDLLRVINGGRLPEEGTDDDPTITRKTFYEWKKNRPKFAEAIASGKEVANGDLLCAAFKKSIGYYVPVQEVVKCKKQRYDPEAKKTLTDEVPEIVEVLKYIEPDPRLIMYMLSNRLPSDYKQKRADEQTDTNVTISFDPLPGRATASAETQGASD
jgi:hypothetical protein